MEQSLLILACCVITVIILILLGKRAKTSENKINENFGLTHKSLGAYSNYVFLTVIFYVYIFETINVAPYIEAHIKIINAAGTLFAFAIASVIATSKASTRAKQAAADGKLDFFEICSILMYILLAISAEFIYLYYGYQAHVGYYEKAISLNLKDLNSLGNPIFGYTKQEIFVKARAIQKTIIDLELNQWKGYERMTGLVMQTVLNIVLNFITTFGYAYSIINEQKEVLKEKDKDKNSDDKDTSTGGDDDFLNPLTEAPDPFRQD